MIGRAIAAAFVLAAATQALAADAAWKTYDYPELGFSVDLPTTPTVQRVSAESPQGTVPGTSIQIDEGEQSYLGITAANYDGFKVPDDLNQSLERSVQGALKAGGVTLVSETTITVDGQLGREVAGRNDEKGFVMHARFVRTKSFLYEIIGLGIGDAGVPADFARVEESFHLKR
jgi:hypothetical protein